MRAVTVLFILLGIAACKNGGVHTTEGGLKYKIFRKNGSLPNNNDYIIVNASFRTSSDSLVFDYKTNGMPLPILFDSARKKQGKLNDMEKVFFSMATKDSAVAEMSPDLFYRTIFYTSVPEGLNEGDLILGSLVVDTIVSRENYTSWQNHQLALRRTEIKARANVAEEKSQQQIDDYLKEHNIDVEISEKGFRYVILEKGTGDRANDKDTVVFSYEGRQLDGELFATSGDDVQKIVLGNPKNIDLWDDVLHNVSDGDKVKIFASYTNAFEGRRPPDVIPGSVVTFTFHVRSVKHRLKM